MVKRHVSSLRWPAQFYHLVKVKRSAFFFSLHVRSADQLLPQLPNDITFEVCKSSPSSPVAPISSASSTATRGGGEGDDEGTGDTSAFIKTERIVSGVHFLTDRAEEDRPDLLLPKSEAGENEPEVRKQVSCPQLWFRNTGDLEGESSSSFFFQLCSSNESIV